MTGNSPRMISRTGCVLALLGVLALMQGCSGGSSSPDGVVKKHIEAARSSDKESFLDTLAKQKRSKTVDMVMHRMRGDYPSMMKEHAKKYEGSYTIESTNVSGDSATVKVSFGGQRTVTFECVKESGWKISNIRL